MQIRQQLTACRDELYSLATRTGDKDYALAGNGISDILSMLAIKDTPMHNERRITLSPEVNNLLKEGVRYKVISLDETDLFNPELIGMAVECIGSDNDKPIFRLPYGTMNFQFLNGAVLELVEI